MNYVPIRGRPKKILTDDEILLANAKRKEYKENYYKNNTATMKLNSKRAYANKKAKKLIATGKE